ncbi:MAG: tRNA pseudouridine(13) synthase TruD [Parcubacteria group bacterium]|nr:tRNA pseudouridine(13) synthase TruD [Parcubacteria group bacterium]
MSVQDQNAWEREQVVVQAAREATPEKFVGSEKEPNALFKSIGIMNTPERLPVGYFKYRPEDFIVEEERPDDTVITVDGKPAAPEFEGGEGTVYFDMTKVGISTIDAENRISEITGYPNKDIGYAGIKDAVALTSQRMSVRGGILNEILMLSLPGAIIRNVHESKGVMQVGGLKGNRFTMMIRTENPVDQAWVDERIEYIKTKGIMNYFGVQRFGTPRFLAHHVGRSMLVDGAAAGVRAYITRESDFELPYFAEKRAVASEQWGDWKAMRDTLSELPYAFRHELDMLDSMIKSDGNFVTALEAVQQQAGLWVRAYASFAANEAMSQAEREGVDITDPMPQMLNADPAVQRIYKNRLEEDGLRNPLAALKKYPFIRVGRNPTIQPKIIPEIHSYKVVPDGLAITFTLPKGAYATTMLMYLFDSVTGYPVPEWLNTAYVDTKDVLGTGSLVEVKEMLGGDIDRIMQRKDDKAEEADGDS